MNTVDVVYDGRQELAEGPVWHAGALYWVEIIGGTLNRFDPRTGVQASRATGALPGAAVPCADGRWLLARGRGFAWLDWDSSRVTPLDVAPAEPAGNRFNDGKCDPAGRFWAGTMDLAERAPRGALYMLDSPRSCRRMLAGVTVSNGLGWSGDATAFFYIDSPTRRIDRFDFDPAAGALANRRVLARIPADEGCPDGLAVDANDNLWVALWGGHAVVCLDGRTGRVVERVEMPVSQPTSCAFGGEKFDELYITSARRGLSDAARAREPLAGGIFRLKPGVHGRPPAVFQPR